MSDADGMPREYLEVLRSLALDPTIRPLVREAVFDLNSESLTDSVIPMPTSWRSDDYRLFCEDRRVRHAELARRVNQAVDDSIEWGARTHLAGVQTEEREAIEAWTRDQFERELRAWLRVNPSVTYER
ncbi:hypothetical protein VX037_07475 [Gordonia sp. Z-3]|uniref:Uncharacterized protein n=1 Tax=Gordonia mangrovi TaxID=2665643 RepID=A0A6L7GN12_9ACTN|nr:MULTISPECIES: hypothetical protein [Gordonia]MAU84189.1 hypothetical protein [Gordonia sp. (in: high G+C Gram-positive bacteria)]MED5800866.1 hypothetical protein [Gordonia sp. Z-3]MXP20923.1 hypothetical protein [Gordonia mangrovi]UVF78527.1 hypothetical protein NWF22_01155 [Gordonia mangrovi]